ncbi:MAG TPA: histidine kinase dimerization/phosphoacceptor domain-containing protein, partial [Pseudonocardia sp.]|nr:histidine kinase dimerization/phosphoacceptor domain-containing protein [Pseudonocardia sp.]
MQGIRVLDGRFRRHPGWTVIGLVALGDRTRAARDRAAQLQERTRELEREREERTRLAVSAERSRTARELHDVAAHGIAVIAVQAAGARRVLHPDPQRAAEALREIEDTARGGLSELRQAVSLLREGAPDAVPQPGPAEL